MARPLGAAPCSHPTPHSHGTRACYVADRCGCDPCTEANRAYNANRTRQQLYGRWDNLVDAEPARQHVRALMAQGMGWKAVASASGLRNSSVITNLLYGKGNRPPTRRLQPDKVARILAVRLQLADHQLTDAAGTTRRLRALVALGWSRQRLAGQLGIGPSNFTPLVDGSRTKVIVATQRAVYALYDELSMTHPPADTPNLVAGVNRAKADARRRGWRPPLAYDDEQLDLPLAAG